MSLQQKGNDTMFDYRVCIEDKAVYDFPSARYDEETAVQQAWDWFNERRPQITVEKVKVNKKPMWAVLNPDGTYAGIPCESEEAARELACQKEGRIVFQMIFDADNQVI